MKSTSLIGSLGFLAFMAFMAILTSLNTESGACVLGLAQNASVLYASACNTTLLDCIYLARMVFVCLLGSHLNLDC